MEVVDYHVHSNNSFDGKNSIEEMCRRAIEKNLSEICFTEHFNVDPRDVSYGVLDYEKYFSEIIKAREKFSDRIRIKCGMEIGEPHLKQYQEDLVKEIENMNLDFIIGSVHNIDGIKLRLYMQNKNKYDIYYDYFSEIYEMVKSSDIDIVGHMDLMKRYAYEAHGNYTFDDYKEIIEKMIYYVENMEKQQLRPHLFLMHAHGLFHNIRGSKAWKRTINEPKANSGTLRELLKKIENF